MGCKLRPPNGVTKSDGQNTIQVVTTVSGDFHKKVRELTAVVVSILESIVAFHFQLHLNRHRAKAQRTSTPRW